jgi:hypothetical protein
MDDWYTSKWTHFTNNAKWKRDNRAHTIWFHFSEVQEQAKLIRIEIKILMPMVESRDWPEKRPKMFADDRNCFCWLAY